MKINTIQIETYSPNAVNNTASKSYSILVNGEKYTVNTATSNNIAQNASLKDTTFSGNTTALAAKKGYAVLINGERYVVGASKNVINKTSNARQAIFDTFKKIAGRTKSSEKLNVIA